MHYVSHGCWSFIIFHRTPRPMLAVVFGLLPDNASWLIYLIYRLATGGGLGKPAMHQIPDWTMLLYGISHSLVVAGAVILLIFVIMRRVPIYVFAWPIAILMDVFTHSRQFLPTPFLWPISDWEFPGISWASWKFMLADFIAIAIALPLAMISRRRKMQCDRQGTPAPAQRSPQDTDT